MKLFFFAITPAFLLALSACAPRPIEVGNNRTGAALIATPSNFGATTITASDDDGQMACTEPRPNASVATALSGNGSLDSEELSSALEGTAKAGVNVGASSEFESVEFLSHGLFGICQLLASDQITGAVASKLAQEVIAQAARLKKVTTVTQASVIAQASQASGSRTVVDTD